MPLTFQLDLPRHDLLVGNSRDNLYLSEDDRCQLHTRYIRIVHECMFEYIREYVCMYMGMLVSVYVCMRVYSNV